MKLAVCLLLPLVHAPSFLAVSRPGNTSQWGLPGGKVDPGEHALQAMLREAREEVGLVLPADELVPLYCDVVQGRGHDDTYWTTTYLWNRAGGPLEQPLVAEAGLVYGWKSEAELTDVRHTPFARYNVGVFEAWRKLRA